ncbi:MAG: aminomethyltransferase family protein [Marivibrio sp.]|uniref:aminomethyltransferase family protein n=1 Tax=Marivibrio sp. TaxID=2039719 RepID=UPI0032EC7C76
MPRREEVRFAVKALPLGGPNRAELMRTMMPHPLVYQELPFDPEFGLYNNRLVALRFPSVPAEDMYWAIRREAVTRHTGEYALEIRGPDAVRLLNFVFTRDVSKVKVGRCSYQFACYDEGGMITDGVLVRLAEDRFWYGQAEGDLYSWLKAHGRGLDVEVIDPNLWISQVQGPNSLKILEAAIDGPYPEPFRYFDSATVSIAGQELLITRTGFTNELGWEYYMTPDIDAEAVGDRIAEVGEAFGLRPISIFGARRIESGLLNAGSDFDETTTPFDVGLGAMVDFEKGEFVGREALMKADRRCRLWGMKVEGEGAFPWNGRAIKIDNEEVGLVCSSAWSPYLQCGVAFVRMDDPEHGPGTRVDVDCKDGQVHPGELCELPMYDKDRAIPRGKLVDIPERIGD